MVAAVIKLFESDALAFKNNGLGILSEATNCTVIEERNGSFELEMNYPVSGLRYSDLKMRRLIVAKPNPFDAPQAFRIYEITKPMNGIISVMAEHISYDLTGYPVRPYASAHVKNAFAALKTHIVPAGCPFQFITDKTTSGLVEYVKPNTARSILGGTEGSILDTYHGEYEWNNFTVTLHENRGSDNGVTIRYGKNLTDLKQEENCASVYSGVYPYWYSEGSEDEQPVLVQLSSNNYILYIRDILGEKAPQELPLDFVRICPLDLSDVFESQPTEAALKAAAEAYVRNNELGVPQVSIDVSFVQLAQSDEYAQYAPLENVRLCDTITVEFPKLGLKAKAKCVKTEFNVLTNKYNKIELGDAKKTLYDAISAISK